MADYLTTYLSEYRILLTVSLRQVVGSQVSSSRGWLVGCACQIVFRWEGIYDQTLLVVAQPRAWDDPFL